MTSHPHLLSSFNCKLLFMVFCYPSILLHGQLKNHIAELLRSTMGEIACSSCPSTFIKVDVKSIASITRPDWQRSNIHPPFLILPGLALVNSLRLGMATHYTFLGTLVMMGLGRVLKISFFLMRAVTVYEVGMSWLVSMATSPSCGRLERFNRTAKGFSSFTCFP